MKRVLVALTFLLYSSHGLSQVPSGVGSGVSAAGSQGAGVLTAPQPANQGAQQSASNSNTAALAMGAASAAAGVIILAWAQITAAECSTWCPIGASLILAGAQDFMQAHQYGGTAQQVSIPGGTTGGPTSSDTNSGAPGLDPYVSGLVAQGQATAAKLGTSLQDLAKQANGGGSGGGGGAMPSMSQLPQDVQDAIAKAKSKADAKYSVTAVAMEGGGGGARKNGASNINFDGLLAGMNGNRDPASVAGLQKSFNGDPIGVAADNIFLQVSRCYNRCNKAKELSRLFLPSPTK